MAKADAVAEQPEETKKQSVSKKDRDRVSAALLRALGRPPGLISVDVYRIGPSSYRVNVIVRGSTVTDTLEVLGRRIAHSFFVLESVGNSGIECDPPIKRVYH